jgi:hypothetical protein
MSIFIGSREAKRSPEFVFKLGEEPGHKENILLSTFNARRSRIRGKRRCEIGGLRFMVFLPLAG